MQPGPISAQQKPGSGLPGLLVKPILFSCLNQSSQPQLFPSEKVGKGLGSGSVLGLGSGLGMGSGLTSAQGQEGLTVLSAQGAAQPQLLPWPPKELLFWQPQELLFWHPC